MKLDELIHFADQFYPDNCIAAYWDDKYHAPRTKPKNGKGDTLALFVVRELSDTYNEELDDKEQFHTAFLKMKSAITEMEALTAALENAWQKSRNKVIAFPKPEV